MVKTLIALMIFWIVVFCIAVSAAQGAYGDPRLDAVATQVAGHPVTVACGSGATEWADSERAAGLTFETDGYTFIGRDNIVHLSPVICDTLTQDFKLGPTAVGDYANGRAIKVLLHEATHQAGFVDEGATDCRALSLVKQYAPSFGYTKTVTKTTYVKVRDGHYKRVTKVVPNPALASLYTWAMYWHRLTPASYQVGC